MWWARRAEDPIGIGARNLRECLLIQIDHLEQHGVTPAVPVAARDDEHVSVLGKGGRRRTVLIDGDGLVVQLRAYLRHTGYRHGPRCRAQSLAAASVPRTLTSTSIHIRCFCGDYYWDPNS